MKKAIILLLLAAVLLAGCAKQTQIVVDTENQTISDGSYTYEYTDVTTGELRIIIIFYPDGGTYTWTQKGNTGSGSFQGNFDHEKYSFGQNLVFAVLNPDPQTADDENTPMRWVMIIAGALIAALGLFQTCRPYKIWDIFLYRWYQEEASNYALMRIIATGLGEIVLGIGVILIAIFVK